MQVTFIQREALRGLDSAASVYGSDLIALARLLNTVERLSKIDFGEDFALLREAKAELDKAFAALDRAFSAPVENKNDFIMRGHQ